jgi:EAL domain-containing protein (putative c-di-GMP-specific phosphodiesterase class I)
LVTRVLTISEESKLDHPLPSMGMGLAEALHNGWIEFWYEPKIDLHKKRLVGIEASARVRHPQDGLLMPSAFLPGAAQSDLIALSKLALTEGLKASLAFAELDANLRLAVDIPVSALTDAAITDVVRSYRPQFAAWPGLTIEVMEEEIIADLALAAELAKKLKAVGVQLGIDDCGPASSALEGLTELPFAELKLGAAFIADCGTDKINAPLCKAVIELAHGFGISVTGTGIERAADALALIDMGCDYGQGFLLGRPMPQERFLALLQQRAGAQMARVVS